MATKQCNKYKEMSFQTQNFPGISKVVVLETNRNSSRTMKENEERERERESYLSSVAEIHGGPCSPAGVAGGQDR